MTTDRDGQEKESETQEFYVIIQRWMLCGTKDEHRDKLVTSFWNSLNFCTTYFLLKKIRTADGDVN